MSFGFGIGDFLAVLELANNVRKDFVGAPEQFKDVSNEVRSLSIVLNDVDVCISECELSTEQEAQLHDISAGCRAVLETLEKTLANYVDLDSTNGSLKKRVRKTWKRLQWEPDEIRDLRGRVTAHLTLLNTFLGGVSRDLISSTKKGVDRLNQRQDDQERVAIEDWLTPIDYRAQQQDFLSMRQPGTGQWLLDSAEYQTWLDTERQALFCPGIPGAGKTILTASTVEDLTTRYGQTPDVGIAYIYCNFRRSSEQTADQLLASILKQLSRRTPALSEHVKELRRQHRESQTRPSLGDISETIRLMASSFSRIFIVVDALDECQTSDGSRAKFLAEILSMQKDLGANLLATSRFIPEVVDEFKESNCVTLEISASPEDVERYVEGSMMQLPPFVHRNLKLQSDIKESIAAAVDGMFLLAYIYLHSLEDKITPKAIRIALQRFKKQDQGTLSETAKVEILSGAYDQVMERINGQLPGLKDLATNVLIWITCAEEPLTTLELRHALAVEVGEPELDEENLPDVETMVSVCAGLVTVDDESGIIRLVHYTAQEYLERTQETWAPDAQSKIASVCVTYLSFLDLEGKTEWDQFFTIMDFRKSHPLHRYAARYWGNHARKVSDEVAQQIADFVSCEERVNAAREVITESMFLHPVDWRLIPDRITGLGLAACFGLEDVVRVLLERGDDPNEIYGDGRTPLFWASQNREPAVVELLLNNPTPIDASYLDVHGQTALAVAAQQPGNEQVVELLLAAGFEPCQGDLLLAAYAGAEDSAKILIATNIVELEWRDDLGRTPLIAAAHHGRAGVVKLLLDTRQVQVDAADDEALTALAHAADWGYADVVELLLAYPTNEDLNAENNYGMTPLTMAAAKGHEAVVRLLLSHPDVDVDKKTRWGKTALQMAAEEGHQAVVILLESRTATLVEWAEETSTTPTTPTTTAEVS